MLESNEKLGERLSSELNIMITSVRHLRNVKLNKATLKASFQPMQQ